MVSPAGAGFAGDLFVDDGGFFQQVEQVELFPIFTIGNRLAACVGSGWGGGPDLAVNLVQSIPQMLGNSSASSPVVTGEALK